MDELESGLNESFAGLGEDWEVVKRALPDGWEAAARETGGMVRARGFDGPATLLRTMLIHLVDGCSLRETAVRANAGGLTDVSDVALLLRMRGCGEWFRWMAERLSRGLSEPSREVLPGKRVRLVDASVVCEPGATGSTWRLHYMIDLATLGCTQVEVTPPEEGETLARFEVHADDVLMGDRGLANRRGIRHVVKHGGDVVVRMNLITVPLEDARGRRFSLLPKLRKLAIGKAQSWPALMRDEHGVIPLRVCALKKSAEQTRIACDKLRRSASKHGRALRPETLEAAGYVIVLTTLPDVSADSVLELYRYRWQIELAFKRLKSLLHLGHLRKTDPIGARAWLQGKLFVAALIETLIAIGERFSPWGYVLHQNPSSSLPMARSGIDAIPARARRESARKPH
jgi:Transposase DDE domain